MARRACFFGVASSTPPPPPSSLLLPPKLVRRLARALPSPRGGMAEPGPRDMRLRRALMAAF
eukprot:CAMPEP_0201892260 /NCGR_PEP_ID=MMETSP0902-20130614/36079_1 /ASSEMBLY_ACC=CAM_ASM_000551 /TAXON_ID=420261 /ORGANISM="Thalassiosira antarctica, Strain CCMP982" /LENGTH=61 /DNA_ID=CAMNT_0048423673 /DNA_START=47 /DNA_END=232 /DNA_ORIENTATION=-